MFIITVIVISGRIDGPNATMCNLFAIKRWKQQVAREKCLITITEARVKRNFVDQCYQLITIFNLLTILVYTIF